MGGDPVLGSTIATFVLAFGALALAEAVAIGGSYPRISAMAEALVWLMRTAALILFVLFLPTFLGVLRTQVLFGSENGLIAVLEQILFTLATLLSQPLLLLGFAEILSLVARKSTLNG